MVWGFSGVLWLCNSLLSSMVFGQGQQPPPPDAPKSAAFPAVVSRSLKNGLRLFVVEDHTVPVVSMRLVVQAGAGTPGVAPGLAAFTARLIDQGTKTRSAEEIARTIDSVGGALDADAGYDSTQIYATVLSAHTALAFDLVSDVARNAAFKPEEIERQRGQAIGDLQVSYADPTFVANVAFRRLVMGNSPLGMPLEGTPDTIKNFTRNQLVEFYQQHYLPNLSFLVVGGDVNAQEVFTQAEKVFGSWKAGTAVAPKTTPATEAKRTKRQIVVIDKPDSAQTEVRVGNPGIARRDPEYFAGMVMNSVLGGGYSARLNREIRIKRGLSYGAGSSLATGRSPGFFQARCATKSQSTREVVDVFLTEMKRLRGENPSAEELSIRKTAFAGDFVRGLQTIGEVVSQVADTVVYGLDLKTLNQYTENVAAVTDAQVQAFAKHRLDTETPLIVLVGDAKVFGEDIRKAYGDVMVVKLSEFDPLSSSLHKPEKNKKEKVEN